ncbi:MULTISPECIES: malonyl-CoA decarboxylase [unclassified Mesorhizobium]|uniref:malonyl-CoA decarboxylase n=1 Tax=unclassified Mesorhizobium TaxID=325217 RepID=UPI002414F629|nr:MULTISPECIES: malonyl-CoA decarboxylase [unclassified Mesorhizobium]MDG4889930.1 malonyl-CoA decarboxylase [Mesorhizobium sp. WSM4887]MDG4904073.1 malonyl-CoA decarboxylase [Mesorhizobium sp. WSM4962]MDG4909100.1 malonyl-CoA decarboxylase [Mesorhizobium sp. WSM4898]MDG4921724.1 malonyl-CoA decarboxylase [Mesorhizobium sp. WSM4989]
MLADMPSTSPSFLAALIENVTNGSRRLLRRASHAKAPIPSVELIRIAEELLSRRGEASGIALAEELLAAYKWSSPQKRLEFLLGLANDFGPHIENLRTALDLIESDPSPDHLYALHAASEPRRQQLFRRINLAGGGTKSLIAMREDLLKNLQKHPELKWVDADFSHLFASWFNRGFLVLKRIDWETPANILEKIIQYEAVHEIADWNDLRNRVQPPDRRCYAFFHPQLVDEPLIFVEVALTMEMPRHIQPLLQIEREFVLERDATTAVFYSISNTQTGLRGVSFGNFLIKQVVQDLKAELPNLKHFATLSPAPRFSKWLATQAASGSNQCGPLDALENPTWSDDKQVVENIGPHIMRMAARYYLDSRDSNGRTIDPVAQFHLSNGARLESINILGDRSEKGLVQSHGVMVNYVYHLADIEANHEAFAERGEIVAAPHIRKLLEPLK